jgi:hypothetical protein
MCDCDRYEFCPECFPPMRAQMPDRFYLIAERREDGGLRITSPEVPGLILSHADPAKVMADVLPAIDALMRHNR